MTIRQRGGWRARSGAGGPPVVEDVELMPPGPREVVVRAGAVEVCVTDSCRELITAVLMPQS
jgi:Zn-dependent alcohol dehydrogenase